MYKIYANLLHAKIKEVCGITKPIRKYFFIHGNSAPFFYPFFVFLLKIHIIFAKTNHKLLYSPI